MNAKASTGWMALLALAAVIFAPPEAFGSGRAILIVTATAAFLGLAIEGYVPTRYLLAGVLGGATLLVHSLVISLDVYRSLEFLTLVWAYYCLFGFFYHSPRDFRQPVALTLVIAAGLVSAYGIHQYFWGLEQAYGYVLYSGASDAIRIPVLERVASGRIFSTFALPGTLWGFLILTLPLHGILWTPEHRARNALLVLNGTLVLSAAVLTRSYGFVLGLLVVLLGWLVTHPKTTSTRIRWKKGGIVLVLILPLVPILYLVRGVQYNPVSLRLQNWLSAWEIFAAHPWGAGLNSYGVVYLQHQQPGANETQFAHNTALQLLAELGIFGLLAAGLGTLWILSKRSERTGSLLARCTGPRRYLSLALMVWLVHNLMDINVYFGSIGTIGIALIALMAWSPERNRTPAPQSALRKRLLLASGLAAVVVVAGSGIVYLSGELLYRSKIESGQEELHRAAQTLETAAWINPFDSAIHHEAGQVALELYHAEHDPEWLERSQSHFLRASRLSPFKVGPHIGLALCFSSIDETDEALRELELAQILHPTNTQVTGIRRLVERRYAAIAGSDGNPIGPPGESLE